MQSTLQRAFVAFSLTRANAPRHDPRMRTLVLLMLLALAACAGPSALLEARQRAPLRDVAALEAWLAANPGGAGRTDVLYVLCEAQTRMSQFRAAAASCGEAIALQGDDAEESSRQALAFWQTLA